MANNVAVKDAAGVSTTMKTTDNAGVHTPHHNVDSLPALPAGTNNIGDVDVLTLPALPAGTNNIGDVDVLTLPALPAGTNNIGDVDIVSLPADVALADNAAFTDGTTKVLPAGFVFDEVAGTALTENDIAAARVDDKRAQVMVIEDKTTRGRRLGVNVDNSITVTQGSPNSSINRWPVGLTDGTNQFAIKGASTAAAASDPSVVVALSPNSPTPAGTNNIGDVDVLTLPALPAGTNNIGDVDVLTLPALPAGTNNIGDVDVLTLPATPAGTNLIGRVNPEPQTANGLSASKTISAATTNATSVKGSAGQVYAIYAHSINAAVRYLKLYNKATAPTVGTDTPVLTLPIPGNAAGAGFVLDTGGMGIAFSTGIGFALTTGVADADTGAVAANEIVVNLLYK